jgi:hypothetical protein
MGFARNCAPAVLATLVVAVGASTAQAQDYNRGRNVSVLQRERPDYQALGIRSGGFTIFPRVEAGIEYTSNVFKTEDNEKSDVYAVVTPSLQALSNWGRHQLQAQAGLNIRQYASETSEDELGWYLRTNGRLDVYGESYLTGGADVEHRYIRRQDDDFPENAAGPLPYTSYGLNGRGLYQGGGRIRMGLGGFVRVDRFSDVDAVGGGRIDLDGRDITVLGGDLRGEYAVSPDTALFVQGSVTDNNYRVGGGVFGPDRDASETKVLAGASFDLTALMRGEIGVGYLRRNYSNQAYQNISGLAIDGTLEYFPTELTTLTMTIRREVQDSIIRGEGGYVNMGGSLRVDHELLRNVLLKAKAEYFKQDYQQLDRSDDVLELSGGGTYFVNHLIGLSATATWLHRKSSGAAERRSFDDGRLMFSIVLQR